MIGLSTLKTHMWCPTSSCIVLSTARHLFDIVLLLETKPKGNIPSFDDCENRMDCGELTESVPELEKFLKESELRLFFDDCPDVKPNPFF